MNSNKLENVIRILSVEGKIRNIKSKSLGAKIMDDFCNLRKKVLFKNYNLVNIDLYIFPRYLSSLKQNIDFYLFPFRWNEEAPRAASYFWGLSSVKSIGSVCSLMPGVPVPTQRPGAWLSASFS